MGLHPSSLPSVRVQSVLYNTPLSTVTRALEFYGNAARIARDANLLRHIDITFGDCSDCCLADISELQAPATGAIRTIDYSYFNENLGHGGGQNRLFEASASDFILIANPDVLVAPRLFVELMKVMLDAEVGIAEARQLPIEHPKYYDPQTGKTSWASMACALVRADVFQQLGGFDTDTFFMYCDDVDLSWRARLSKHKVVHQPNAMAFHDKRISQTGSWVPTQPERYFSAEAALLLPYKYSRPDLTKDRLNTFLSSSDQNLVGAALSYNKRESEGRLPVQIDTDHLVAEFDGGHYGPVRFEPV